MKIDIKPFIDSIKTQLTTGAFSQFANAQVLGLDHLKDVEKRLAVIVAAVVAEEVSYAFVVRRLAEEPENLKAFIISIATGAVVDAENVAKGIVSEFEKFLREQILAQ